MYATNPGLIGYHCVHSEYVKRVPLQMHALMVCKTRVLSCTSLVVEMYCTKHQLSSCHLAGLAHGTCGPSPRCWATSSWSALDACDATWPQTCWWTYKWWDGQLSVSRIGMTPNWWTNVACNTSCCIAKKRSFEKSCSNNPALIERLYWIGSG